MVSSFSSHACFCATLCPPVIFSVFLLTTVSFLYTKLYTLSSAHFWHVVSMDTSRKEEPGERFALVYKESGCHHVLGITEGCSNRNRLLFHLSHKFGDEKRLMSYHQNLQDVIEDQLSLASIHYLRSHYQEAIDIYKRILLDNRCFSES